jgi:hypothetical protein
LRRAISFARCAGVIAADQVLVVLRTDAPRGSRSRNALVKRSTCESKNTFPPSPLSGRALANKKTARRGHLGRVPHLSEFERAETKFLSDDVRRRRRRDDVNAAFGNCSQTARSSAVTVSPPNLNMYRLGSVTRPTCAQVTLLTANHLPFTPTLLQRIRFNSRAFIFTDPT